MAEYLDGIRARVLQKLLSEYDPAKTVMFEPDAIDVFIGEVVARISKARPYEVKESVTLTATLKNEVSIASITSLISIPYGEYPVDKDPRRFRNITIFASIATFVMNVRPSGDETAYLYCYKLHSITESSSTLTPALEDILVTGVAALAANSKSRKQINSVNVGGGRVAGAHLTWAEVTWNKFLSELGIVTKQRIRQMFSED